LLYRVYLLQTAYTPLLFMPDIQHHCGNWTTCSSLFSNSEMKMMLLTVTVFVLLLGCVSGKLFR